MGRSYLFECGKCSYRAIASGGADRGFDCLVQTILCRDCKKLYDAITEMRVNDPAAAAGDSESGTPVPLKPPAFAEVVERLPLPAAQNFKWVKFKPQCPVSSDHLVEIWNDPGRCPVCRSFMEKAGLAFRMWE